MRVDMAPDHSHCPLPHMLSVPRDTPGVSTSECPTLLSAIVLPRMLCPKKRLETDWLMRVRMFQVFHKAFRHLRAVLFKILSHCVAVVNALRPEVSHLSVVMDVPVNTAPLGIGVYEDPMGECWVEEQGSTVYSWMWTPQQAQQGEDLVCALEEDDFVASLDDSSDGAFLGRYEGGEQVVDLADWLDLDSCEESPDGENFYFDGTPKDAPGQCSLSSEELEWDSDSSWSDDDDNDSEENTELWESFLRSDDPYNPLSLSSKIKPPTTCQKEASTLKSVQARPGGVEIFEKEKQHHMQGLMIAASHKKVWFSEKVEVHPLVAWGFASRASRDGSCWLQMARDRERFRRRVAMAGEVIMPVLLPEHRALVWDRLSVL